MISGEDFTRISTWLQHVARYQTMIVTGCQDTGVTACDNIGSVTAGHGCIFADRCTSLSTVRTSVKTVHTKNGMKKASGWKYQKCRNDCLKRKKKLVT